MHTCTLVTDMWIHMDGCVTVCALVCNSCVTAGGEVSVGDAGSIIEPPAVYWIIVNALGTRPRVRHPPQLTLSVFVPILYVTARRPYFRDAHCVRVLCVGACYRTVGCCMSSRLISGAWTVVVSYTIAALRIRVWPAQRCSFRTLLFVQVSSRSIACASTALVVSLPHPACCV